MLAQTRDLLRHARANGYAVGAFNVYNLEGALAVTRAAEEMQSPVMLQMLPSALRIGGQPMVAMCLAMAEASTVPVAVHLDHCSDTDLLAHALEWGVSSVMADGAGMTYVDNVRFTAGIVALAREKSGSVEGELGKLSGEEDGLSVSQREAKLTSPDEAALFVEQSGVDALAVCIGNVHGRYLNRPELDFVRLRHIARVVACPLVLHGTSGLPDTMIRQAMEIGVCKFNVNTEVRERYLDTLRQCSAKEKVELVGIMERAIEAMAEPVREKMRLFCSAGRAGNRK